MKANFIKTVITLLSLPLVEILVPRLSHSQITEFSRNISKTDSASIHSFAIAQKSNDNKIPLETRLVNANTQFGFNLFARISQQGENKNIFISPLSISLSLSMIYNGANAATQQEIAKTLEVNGIAIKDVNIFNQKISQSLINTKGIDLNISNSLWISERFPVKQSFLDKLKGFYQSEIMNLDFNKPSAVKIINDWVKRETKGKITEILSPRDSNENSRFFIINAIYFKGEWLFPFPEEFTESQPFTLANRTQIQHPAMSRRVRYQYFNTPKFQAIRLPYKDNDRPRGLSRFSMEIFLPKPNSNLIEFQKQLTVKNWLSWSDEFKKSRRSYSEVYLQLPKFEVQYDIDLIPYLKQLGMKVSFDPKSADFSNLSTKPLFINMAKHKTFVNVDEKGTKAAAVTVLGGVTTGQAEAMIVNRPFFFTISDQQTGTILFMGTVNNPSSK